MSSPYPVLVIAGALNGVGLAGSAMMGHGYRPAGL